MNPQEYMRIPPRIEHIVGIDEVGRGPIAGPLVLAAWVIDRKVYAKWLREMTPIIRDSKKLSASAREKWFTTLREKTQKHPDIFSVYTIRISASRIDREGMSAVLRFALSNVLKKTKRNPKTTYVLCDGSLPLNFSLWPHGSVIKKGDEKEPAIAAASIYAKVTRDRLVSKYDKEYPNYGFSVHKGYGTTAHYKAINKYGITELHRRTWIEKQ